MANKILTENIEKTLELLEYAFEMRQDLSTEKSGIEGRIVCIFSPDILRVGLTVEDLRETLNFLVVMFPDIKKEDFDFENESIDLERLRTESEPVLFEIELPNKLPEIVRKVREEYHIDELQGDNRNAGHTKASILSKVSFNEQTGILSCLGKVSHAFQKGSHGDRAKLSLFRLLWANRVDIKNGVIIKKGENKGLSYYAVKIGLCIDVGSFNKNINISVDAKNLVKSINRIFKDKKYLLKIRTKGGNIILENIIE